MRSIEGIICHWQTQGIRLNPGGSPDLLVAVEQGCQFAFPASFKAFYRLANGFQDNDWTSDMFSLWPLEKIQVEYEANEERTLIPFCDYLIHSHCIGFVKNKPGIYKMMYGTVEEIFLCEHFDQALEWIALGAEELY